MERTPADIAARLFSAIPDALHLEMCRWLVTEARITDPNLYREVIREYRLLQQRRPSREPAFACQSSVIGPAQGR